MTQEIKDIVKEVVLLELAESTVSKNLGKARSKLNSMIGDSLYKLDSVNKYKKTLKDMQ